MSMPIKSKGFFSVAIAILAILILITLINLQRFEYVGYKSNDELRFDVLKTEEAYYLLDKKITNKVAENTRFGAVCDLSSANIGDQTIDLGTYCKATITGTYAPGGDHTYNALMNCDFGDINYLQSFTFIRYIVGHSDCLTFDVKDPDSG